MEVKIDTKEKFTVVTPVLSEFSDNIAAEIAKICKEVLQKPVKNLILNLQNVTSINEPAASVLSDLQQNYYEHNASFVICSLQDNVESSLDKMELLDMLNITPTESEAWDIVQMEEIERELLDSDDMEFGKQE